MKFQKKGECSSFIIPDKHKVEFIYSGSFIVNAI